MLLVLIRLLDSEVLWRLQTEALERMLLKSPWSGLTHRSVSAGRSKGEGGRGGRGGSVAGPGSEQNG